MKILAPVSSPAEVESIIDSGAEELYCGVLSPKWNEIYSNIASINRVERKMGNLGDYGQLKEIVDIAHKRGAKVNVSFNALYSAPQYELLREEVSQLVETGVDALIIADLGMLLYLRSLNISQEIHISTGGTVFNSEAARFYSDLGAKRTVLPRSFNSAEICQFKKNVPAMDFEVFIMNGGCMNEDGFCTFHHGLRDGGPAQNFARSPLGKMAVNSIYCLPPKVQEIIMKEVTSLVSDNACGISYKIKSIGDRQEPDELVKKAIERIKDISRRNWLNTHVCGACRMWNFYHAGIFAVKIVGRTFTSRRKLKDVEFIVTLRDSLKERAFTEQEFKDFTRKKFVEFFKIPCHDNCFYPT